MPGTRNDFGQMFDNELNPRKGWAGDRGMALEKSLPINGSLTNAVKAGAVVHINASNEFVLGTDTTNSSLTIARPPLFAFQNENDFDVNPDLGNIAGGVLMALCCLGDFELESTEVDSGQTFVVGNYLTADNGAAGGEDGKLKVGTLSTNPICGIVSETGTNTDGTFENDHGKNVVRFWTWFLPEQVDATA